MSKQKNKVTLADIARESNCTTAVVSSVLRGQRGNIGCSSEMRETILAKAKKLGYQLRRQTVSAQKKRVLVLLQRYHEADVGYEYSFLHPFSLTLDRAGVAVETSIFEEDLPPAAIFEKIEQRAIDLIVSFAINNRMCMETAAKWGIPSIQVNPLVVPECNAVFPDDAQGTREAVEFLSALSVERIFYLEEETSHCSREIRKKKLVEACAEKGILLQQVCMDVSETLMQEIKKQRPQVLVTYNDRIAHTVYNRLRNHGVRVPEHLGILSLSGIRQAETPLQFTHVGLPMAELGRAAADRALDVLRSRSDVAANIFVAEYFCVGHTCRAAAQLKSLS